MCLLRNNSVSAYSVCVYTETFCVFWRAWFSHSVLPSPFSSDYKSRWLQQFELQRILSTATVPKPKGGSFSIDPDLTWIRQACGERNQARPGWAGFILEDKTLQRKQQSESVFGSADEAHRCVLHAVSQQSDSLMCLKGRASQRVFSTNSSSRSKPHDSQH